MPTSNARPHVSDLLLAGTPNLFGIVKVFFDRPTIRNGLQDHLNTHRGVRADVRGPGPARVFQQYDTNRSANNVTGRQKRLEATLRHDTATSIADRLPAVAARGALAQADSVLSVLAWSPALPKLVHGKAKQFGITPKPRHDRRPFGEQRTHECFERTGWILFSGDVLKDGANIQVSVDVGNGPRDFKLKVPRASN